MLWGDIFLFFFAIFIFKNNKKLLNKHMKRTIRLRESELRRIVSESVKKVINEFTLPNGSNVNRGVVTTPSGRRFNTNKPGTRKGKFNLNKNCEVQPNGTKVWDNGDVATPSGRNFNLKKESLNRIVSESVRRVLNERKRILREHEDDWFDEDDEAYIGRTEAYYNEDDDYVYTPDLWTYDNTPNSKDFAGDVFRLNDEGKRELNWWIRCQRFNGYQRKNAFNPNTNSPEEEWETLMQYAEQVR